jgi:hypothetical protein
LLGVTIMIISIAWLSWIRRYHHGQQTCKEGRRLVRANEAPSRDDTTGIRSRMEYIDGGYGSI